MKIIIGFSVLLLSVFCYHSLFAQALKKEQVKVWGNCGMCKKTIEKAAKKAGAQTASWDAVKQMLSISYDDAKTHSAGIQQAIAKTGYDTQDFTGDDEAYNNLPGCCQYDRKAQSESVKKACCDESTCGKPNSKCASKGCCKNKSCCKP